LCRFGLRLALVLPGGPPLVRLLRMRLRLSRARRGQAGMADATGLYRRMLDIVRRRGYERPPWFTPAELAASLLRNPLGSGSQRAAYSASDSRGKSAWVQRQNCLIRPQGRRRQANRFQ
jgi:Domain of unknown function (DUF4129)